MTQSNKTNTKDQLSKILFWTGEAMLVLGALYMVRIFHVLWALTLPNLPYQETIIQFKSWSITPGFAIFVAGILICGLATGKVSDIIKSLREKK